MIFIVKIVVDGNWAAKTPKKVRFFIRFSQFCQGAMIFWKRERVIEKIDASGTEWKTPLPPLVDNLWLHFLWQFVEIKPNRIIGNYVEFLAWVSSEKVFCTIFFFQFIKTLSELRASPQPSEILRSYAVSFCLLKFRLWIVKCMRNVRTFEATELLPHLSATILMNWTDIETNAVQKFNGLYQCMHARTNVE